MPERVATADSDFESPMREFLSRAFGSYARDMIAICVAVIAAGSIFVNALYRQPGPHPAPIFAIKSRPVATEPANIVPVMPRARPEPAVTQKAPELPAAHPRVEPAKIDPVPVPVAKPAPKADPIAALLNPAAAPAATSKVMQVQRALNDFGYGPVKASGSIGPDTVTAIQKFERERKLPATGQISPRFLKELSAATGRQFD